MKKIALLSMMVFTVFVVSAQKIEVSKVPAVVKSSFDKAHPGVIAKWEKEDGNYEINFKENNNDMSVLIDAQGAIVETETDIKTTELPAAALSYLRERYNGKPIKESARILKADGTIIYEAEVSGSDIMFDAKGKFIKVAKD